MKLELTKDHPILDGNIIDVKNIAVPSLLSVLGSNDRLFKLDLGVSIYVFDQSGVRFWARNNVAYQVQFLLEESDDPKSPKGTFQGDIFLESIYLSRPVLIKTIQAIPNIKVVQDDDSLQYKLNIYQITFQNRKYRFWVDDRNERVVSIHCV